MPRVLVFALTTIVLLSACLRMPSKGKSSNPSSSNGRGDASSKDETRDRSPYAAAAAKLEDACTLMPSDLVRKLAPGAYPPSTERYPLRCTVRNDTCALEITFDTGPDDAVKGAEFIAGLAKGGYAERLDPKDRGDVYLTVILGSDLNGINHNLYVEVAGHDGKDHRNDAIAIARDILAHLTASR